jgi:hypothetical protein
VRRAAAAAEFVTICRPLVCAAAEAAKKEELLSYLYYAAQRAHAQHVSVIVTLGAEAAAVRYDAHFFVEHKFVGSARAPQTHKQHGALCQAIAVYNADFGQVAGLHAQDVGWQAAYGHNVVYRLYLQDFLPREVA